MRSTSRFSGTLSRRSGLSRPGGIFLRWDLEDGRGQGAVQEGLLIRGPGNPVEQERQFEGNEIGPVALRKYIASLVDVGAAGKDVGSVTTRRQAKKHLQQATMTHRRRAQNRQVTTQNRQVTKKSDLVEDGPGRGVEGNNLGPVKRGPGWMFDLFNQYLSILLCIFFIVLPIIVQ